MFDRTRWSAFGAAVAVTLAAGLAIPGVDASVSPGAEEDRGVFVPITPCRLMDTRAADRVGPRNTPIGQGEVHTQAVTGSNGNCTIPVEAIAVSMNVTAVNPTLPSFLTIFPADADRPLASSLNWTATSPPTPNKVDVRLSADGRINLFNPAGTIDVLADVVGYFTNHGHDDRYYTKGQVDDGLAAVNDTERTDTYPPSAMVFVPSPSASVIQPSFVGGICASHAGATAHVARIPLTLPVGALLYSVDVATFDGIANGAYSVSLRKTVLAATGAATGGSTAIVATLSGGELNSRLRHHVLSAGEIVDVGESFYVEVGLFGSNDSGFCGLTVTYDSTPIVALPG